MSVYGKPVTAALAKSYYVAESTYGTTPTNPSFQWLGVIQSVDPDIDRSILKLKGIGSRDLQYLLKGMLKAAVNLEYAYQNGVFAQLANSLTPFSFEYFTDDGTLINSYLHMGSVIESVTVSAAVEKNVTVKPQIYCQNVTPAIAHPTGATYASDPGTTPKMFYDTHVNLGITAIDGLTDWDFTIKNNLQRFPVIRPANADLLKYMIERGRDLSGTLKVAYLSNAMLSDMIACNEQAALVIVVGSDTYTFNNVKYDTGKLSAKVIEPIPVDIKWTAKTLTIS